MKDAHRKDAPSRGGRRGGSQDGSQGPQPPSTGRPGIGHTPYVYQALIVSAYDGDTVRADVDLGFSTWTHRVPMRLARIDAPELRGDHREAGLAARDRLRELVGGRLVLIRTYKDSTDKYGRYLADIYLDDGRCVNDLLVAEGHARYASY